MSYEDGTILIGKRAAWLWLSWLTWLIVVGDEIKVVDWDEDDDGDVVDWDDEDEDDNVLWIGFNWLVQMGNRWNSRSVNITRPDTINEAIKIIVQRGRKIPLVWSKIKVDSL